MIWLANIVLIVHALIVLFIVGGLIAIWVGALFRVAWARNRVFRSAHIGAIGVVALLAALNIPCPLTVAEDYLRAGSIAPQGFIQRWISAWLFYDFPAWVFVFVYVLFFLSVVLTWWWIPPRRKR